MTLTEFLLGRIAEDEAVAQDAAKYLRPGDYIDITLSMYDQESGESHSKRIRSWQPERVLAECEAKRRMVADLAQVPIDDFHPETHPQAQWAAARTLRNLALPYADHPDYRDEWRP